VPNFGWLWLIVPYLASCGWLCLILAGGGWLCFILAGCGWLCLILSDFAYLVVTGCA